MGWSDEAGVALLYAMFALLILAGIATVLAAQAVTEIQATAQSRDFEAAVHVAEAGAEELIDEINSEGDTFSEKVITEGPPAGNSSGTVDDHAYPPTGMSDEEWVTALAEADWQRAQDDPGYETRLIETGQGHAYAVRPKVSGASPDEASEVLLAVGFVPGIDAADRTERVIRMRIDRQFFRPEHALQTDGGLEFGGDAEIVAPECDASDPEEEVCNADVHANGDVDVSGSSHRIEGRLTTHGTISGTPNAVVGSSQGEEIVPVPPIDAEDFYQQHDTALNADPEGQAVEWWDLCPDGTVRPPSTAGPCQNSTVQATPTGNQSTKFNGWRFKNGTWEATDVEAGAFYVYHSDVSITGSAGSTHRAVSVLVQRDDAASDNTGSMSVSGNPQLTPALPGVMFVADRDLDLSGNAVQTTCEGDAQANYAGLISVGEQLKTRGTVDLEGSMVVQDREDVSSLVRRNNDGLGGTMCLRYDDDLKVDLAGVVTIEFWNEL